MDVPVASPVVLTTTAQDEPSDSGPVVTALPHSIMPPAPSEGPHHQPSIASKKRLTTLDDPEGDLEIESDFDDYIESYYAKSDDNYEASDCCAT